jgi:hypothetical protein
MRRIGATLGALVVLSFAVPEAAEAKPGGCLKYGLGGAIAGHFAGGHRWKGAALGCALGIYQRRRHESQVEHRERLRGEEMRQRRRSADDDVVARRPRRDFDPTETGTLRQRRDRERGTFY